MPILHYNNFVNDYESLKSNYESLKSDYAKIVDKYTNLEKTISQLEYDLRQKDYLNKALELEITDLQNAFDRPPINNNVYNNVDNNVDNNFNNNVDRFQFDPDIARIFGIDINHNSGENIDINRSTQDRYESNDEFNSSDIIERIKKSINVQIYGIN